MEAQAYRLGSGVGGWCQTTIKSMCNLSSLSLYFFALVLTSCCHVDCIDKQVVALCVLEYLLTCVSVLEKVVVWGDWVFCGCLT